ncbi:MAG: hypothetical protein LIR46_07660 [Bacteroidota bacterium]|nr:hypothetical protein [Bacteroidota bacterium]
MIKTFNGTWVNERYIVEITPNGDDDVLLTVNAGSKLLVYDAKYSDVERLIKDASAMQ